jgi:AcrR family transcriptional regulator
MLLGVAGHMLGQGDSGSQAVRTWLTAFAPFCSEVRGEHGCLSVNTSLEASELVPEVRAAIDAFQEAIQALLQAALDRGRAQGELPPGFDSQVVARLLLVAQSGFMVMAASRPSSAETLAAMARLLDALLPPTPTCPPAPP